MSGGGQEVRRRGRIRLNESISLLNRSEAGMAHPGPSTTSAEPYTRSRTQLFLSFRSTRPIPNSRRASYTPYLDQDDWDDDARESSGLLDLESGRRGSTRSLGGERGATPPGGGGAKLPPVWVDSADQVDDIVERIKPKSAYPLLSLCRSELRFPTSSSTCSTSFSLRSPPAR